MQALGRTVCRDDKILQQICARGGETTFRFSELSNYMISKCWHSVQELSLLSLPRRRDLTHVTLSKLFWLFRSHVQIGQPSFSSGCTCHWLSGGMRCACLTSSRRADQALANSAWTAAVLRRFLSGQDEKR